MKSETKITESWPKRLKNKKGQTIPRKKGRRIHNQCKAPRRGTQKKRKGKKQKRMMKSGSEKLE